MSERSEQHPLYEKAKSAPNLPGVYFFLNAQGHKIYVGKARSLRKRLQSYFGKIVDPKFHFMLEEANDLDYEVLDSEDDALRRERELIPSRIKQEFGAVPTRYNIHWQDDKTWPYLKLTVQEEFPRLLIVRDKEEDGALYIGRKLHTNAVRRSLKTIRKSFPVCVCQKPLDLKPRKRPCLDFQLGLCSAPCCGKILKDDYQQIVGRLISFFQGKREDLMEPLYLQMGEASQNLEYERAALIRDKIKFLELAFGEEEQAKIEREKDLITFSRSEDHFGVLINQFQEGKIIGSFQTFVEGVENLPDEEIMTSFFLNYYLESTFIPSEILTPVLPSNLEQLIIWFNKKKQESVVITDQVQPEEEEVWRRSTKEIEITTRNRRENLEREKENLSKSLEGLRDVLNLAELPLRIECYDISNIQGSNPVGSRVVFLNGLPSKKDYRKFRIKTVEGINDVAMMHEVLSRRLNFLKIDPSDTPNLIIVDGGRGQLNAAVSVLSELDLENILAIGLAKRLETIYLPSDKPSTINLPFDSPVLFLLQRIRDEAHRFAISYHRLLRAKHMKQSILDDVPGVGEKRRNAIREQFPDIHSLKNASVEDLAKVSGVSRKLAEVIFTHVRFTTQNGG